MEKLELKHLAPYLPYSLKVMDLYDNKERFFVGYSINHTEQVKISVYKNLLSTGRLSSEVKPILRPLSDLTTSHNIFEDKAICFIDESDNGGSFTIDDIYFKYQESSFSDWRNAYSLLLKNHFDVFGLIEKGLAIDINTIKK